MSQVITRPDLIATVSEIIAREFDVPADQLTSELDLRTLEGADSVKVLRAIARIELAYDVELDDECVFTLHTVNDVVDALEALVAEGHRT